MLEIMGNLNRFPASCTRGLNGTVLYFLATLIWFQSPNYSRVHLQISNIFPRLTTAKATESWSKSSCLRVNVYIRDKEATINLHFSEINYSKNIFKSCSITLSFCIVDDIVQCCGSWPLLTTSCTCYATEDAVDCWVAQLVSRHRPVNKISAQTRWRHATVLEYGSYATCRSDVTRQQE
jgi:hypothetical protein